MPRYVILPANLCSEKKHDGVSIYYRDYCSRHKYNKSKKHNYQHKIPVTIENPTKNEHLSLPRGYGVKEFNETIDGIKSKEEKVKNMDELIQHAPEALNQIENAWVSEVDASKRDRGLVYGVAGAKMNIHNRKSKSENDKPLPGLNKWLETANEYEKGVVHKFVSSINSTMKERSNVSSPQRYSSRGSIRSVNENVKTRSCSASFPVRKEKTEPKSVRIRSAPISAESFRYTPQKISIVRRSTPGETSRKMNDDVIEGDVIQTSDNSDMFQNEAINEEDIARIPSRSSTSESQRFANTSPRNSVSTQMPYKYGSKPSSPLYDKNKSKSTPDITHSCKQCETCRRKEVKKLLEAMCKTSPPSYDYIRLERALQPSKPNEEYIFPQEDYIHASTSFQRVNGLKKRYFIIHPDFVSENTGNNLKSKRRLQKKYFGESQVAGY